MEAVRQGDQYNGDSCGWRQNRRFSVQVRNSDTRAARIDGVLLLNHLSEVIGLLLGSRNYMRHLLCCVSHLRHMVLRSDYRYPPYHV